MPSICNALGVSFEYPENWSFEVSDSESETREVTVSGPETAFWQLSRHEPTVELERLFDEALAALRAEYREIEVWPAAQEVEGRRINGYDVNFYCLDLTVTTWLRGLPTSTGTYLLVCQAEDRELQLVAPVFQAMLVSLLRGLG